MERTGKYYGRCLKRISIHQKQVGFRIITKIPMITMIPKNIKLFCNYGKNPVFMRVLTSLQTKSLFCNDEEVISV